MLFDGSVGLGTLALLVLCLGIALAFEFVNGFHDTANAVATVIYTKSLRPGIAVGWSGLMNFLGVFFGGTAVAFSIVHLLPVDLLINIGETAGLLMVLSLLISAIVWNFGTWYLGLPASSSHALIGSILGVGLASSLFSGQGFGSGVNWAKARDVGMSLLLSPIIGFCLAALLLLLLKVLVRDPRLYKEPDGDKPPPLWIRLILLVTCTGVSYAHGSNDGQKGIGLIMLILIGLLPGQYALNATFDAEKVRKTVAAIERVEPIVARAGLPGAQGGAAGMAEELKGIRRRLEGRAELQTLPTDTRKQVRADVLRAEAALSTFEKERGSTLSEADRQALKEGRASLRGLVDFVVPWVVVAVALALGIGTTVGWKRIVVTVGEKIGKTHLTYAQGASAELVAMTTIAAADHFGLPVSTTHILSSGIAGTMAANRAGLQAKTLRNIALAWILTLPVTMLMAGTLFTLTAWNSMKKVGPRAVAPPSKDRVLKKLD